MTKPELQFHPSTPQRVKDIVRAACGQRDCRLVFEYGSQSTGESRGDSETGYVGSSSGVVRIPLVIANARSHGGGALLDHCVVRILTARGKRVIWQHPQYQSPQD